MIKEPIKAIYGCKDNSHELLSCDGNITPPRELLGLTDKPGGHITPREKWWPAINCGPVGKFWALWCIEPDMNAPRSGMVKSTAYLWDIDDISELNNLQHYIFQLTHDTGWSEPPHELLANIYGELIFNSNILVVEQIKSLPLIIAHIWNNLWKEARKEFSIRVSFTPPQVLKGAKQPTLYCVPSSLVNQWYLPDITLINSTTMRKSSRAVSYLISKEREDLTFQEVLCFSNRLHDNLKILNRISRTADSIDLYHQNPTLANAITAFRSIVALSPSQEQATTIKTELLNSIKKLMVSSSDALDILAMANFSSEVVSKDTMPNLELSAWIELQLLNLDQDNVDKFFERAQPNKSEDWWAQSVIKGISKLVNTTNSSKYLLYWLTRENFQLIFLSLSSIKSNIEQHLFEVAISSNFSSEELCKLKDIFLWKQWPKLYAWVTFKLYDEELVYEKQKNSMPNWENGIPFLIDNFSVKHVVNLLRDESFSPYIDLLVNRVLKEPIILDFLDISESKSLNLWERQLNNGGVFYPPSIDKVEFQRKLCGSFYADFSSNTLQEIFNETAEYLLISEDRVNIWSYLQPQKCQILAEHLAKVVVSDPNLLNNLRSSELYLINALKKILDSHRILHPKFILAYISQPISHFESDVLIWIKKADSSNWNEHTHQLGDIILSKNWSLVANSLYESSFGFFSKTPHFQPTVIYCSNLLNQRNSHWLEWYEGKKNGVHKSEIIKRFSKIGANIAFERLDYIWQMAGGDLGKLKSSGTELEKWVYAIKEAENGALSGGSKSILKILMEEYPNNSELQEIYYIYSDDKI